MASFVFFICNHNPNMASHVACVYKLAKKLISLDTLVNFSKSQQI